MKVGYKNIKRYKEILHILVKYGFTFIVEKLNLKKVDDSYSYLLNMPLYTLTKEHLQSLQDDLKNSKEKYKTVNETTIQQMWISDIKYLK